MSSLLDRISGFFLDPPSDREAPAAPSARERTAPERGSPLGLASSSAPRSSLRGYAPPAPPGSAPPTTPAEAESAGARAASPSADPGYAAAPDSAGASEGTGAVGFAAVLGAPAAAVPVAAACAGELRVQARAAAAVLCVWRGGELPTGATTPAVRRLVGRLAADGTEASACGRVAWIVLDAEPERAAEHVQRCRAIVTVPLVLVVAGPRAPAFEPLLADAELAIAVLPTEADDALRLLAVSTLPSRQALVLPPLPPGPPRWAAMAGLARLRSLKAARP